MEIGVKRMILGLIGILVLTSLVFAPNLRETKSKEDYFGGYVNINDLDKLVADSVKPIVIDGKYLGCPESPEGKNNPYVLVPTSTLIKILSGNGAEKLNDKTNYGYTCVKLGDYHTVMNQLIKKNRSVPNTDYDVDPLREILIYPEDIDDLLDDDKCADLEERFIRTKMCSNLNIRR